MVDKNKAVVCCLLTTSAIMLSEKKKRKRKLWSKKWHLKRNISCDGHLLNELLETDLPWGDAIMVSASKLRKLWDSLSELHSSVCERRLERTVLRPALLPDKTAQFYSVFPSGMTSHIKIAQFNWEGIRPFIHQLTYMPFYPHPAPPSWTAILVNSEERLRKAGHGLRGWHPIQHISVVKGNRQTAISITDRNTDSWSYAKRSGLL
jgi:hypothetical protein